MSCMQLVNLEDEETVRYLYHHGRLPVSNYQLNSGTDDPGRCSFIMNLPWKWPDNSVITCKFVKCSDLSPGETENPLTDYVSKKIQKYAHQWEKYMNLKFKFVKHGDADIRISLVAERGSYSYIGTGCKHESLDGQATMNFGWLTDYTGEKEFSRVVLHEFGHALGLEHEQFSPTAKFTLIPEVVIKYFKSYGWDEQTTRLAFNNFEPIDPNNPDYKISKWDPLSIMHYYILPQWTKEGIEVKESHKLSKMDKALISEMYPKH